LALRRSDGGGARRDRHPQVARPPDGRPDVRLVPLMRPRRRRPGQTREGGRGRVPRAERGDPYRCYGVPARGRAGDHPGRPEADRATVVADGLGEIPVDDDFLTLAGYYLAEGTLSGAGGKPYQQFFYFHEDQVTYVDRLRGILRGLGLKTSVQRRRHTAEVIAHSLALGRLLLT